MMTLKEEILSIELKKILYTNGLDDAIKYLFNHEEVTNVNIAIGFVDILLQLSGINIYGDEIRDIIINIMSKKNNIDDLSKYNNLDSFTSNVLNTWKKEKEESIQLLLSKFIELSVDLGDNTSKYNDFDWQIDETCERKK